MSVTWVDNVTPLNAANMGVLEQTGRKGAANGYAGLDASQNLPLVVGGKIIWAGDVNLYRQASPLRLKTDYSLTTALDLEATGDVYAQKGGAAQVWITPKAGAAAIYFGSAIDTNLYRSGAGILKTDSVLCSATSVISSQGLANQLQMHADGRLYFGNAADTYLYRNGTNFLKTDGRFDVGGKHYVNGNLISYGFLYVQPGKIYLGADDTGATPDTNLYRWAAGRLGTDGTFMSLPSGAGGIAFASYLQNTYFDFQINGDGKHLWGTGLAPTDTTLYRAAASRLATDGQFSCQFPALAVLKTLDVGAADSGGAGYRMVRIPN